MKKTIFFLIAVMALVVTGCDWFHKADLSKVDMVVIQHGQMLFYNHDTQKLTPYEAEKDSVVNLAFDNNNHLYYTTAQQQDFLNMFGWHNYRSFTNLSNKSSASTGPEQASGWN